VRPRAAAAFARRGIGSLAVALVFFLESKCSSGAGRPAPSGPGAPAASALSAYESQRSRAWDPSRRFKALFRAEVSPKVGAVGRGYLSVWWDGASGVLTWRTSAPIAGGGRGGILRVKEEEGKGPAGPEGPPLSSRLSAPDLIACILGAPDAPPSNSITLDGTGRVIGMRFPSGEIVSLEPGEGVPRRIEARGRDGRAILTLESYAPWPTSEQIPPL
jgi:hypothetical protein